MDVPILMYHRIAPKNRSSTVQGHYVHPRAFARQMTFLSARGYSSVSLDTVFTRELPEKPVVITFDDGYENFYTSAVPALAAHGFTATVFAVANLIGKTNEWDQAAGDVVERLMSRDQLQEVAQQGFGIGSHTLDHADLPSLPEDQAWCQIADSKAVLEDTLGIPITTFCYPYGRKSPAVMEMVERAGYRLACSTEKGMNTLETNRFALRRINVRSDTSLPVFMLKLMRGRS